MENLEMIVQQQAGLLSWNFKEINESVDAITKRFDGTVYTDEMIADAKKDKASLNKLAKEINAKKVAVKKEYSKPYDLFEKQVKEVIAKINNVSDQIDEQVKDYEARQKEEKKQIISAYWNSLETGIGIDEVFDPGWLNKTCTEKLWKTDLDLKAERFKRDRLTIDAITDDEQKIFFEEEYQKNHDIAECMSKWTEYQRIRDLAKKAQEEAESAQKKLIEAAAAKAEQLQAEEKKASEMVQNEPTERVYTRVLNVRGTKEQLNKLAAFMKSMNIEYWGESSRQ